MNDNVSNATRRDLVDGCIIGIESAYRTYAWLGIPFADPPVGKLRWRAPRRRDRYDNYEALSFGPVCRQSLPAFLGTLPTYRGSEDCLYLNIWAPRLERNHKLQKRLPVMVWIHGGGNVFGSGSESGCDGSKLAGTQQVIVVSFNYRLGPLGWLSHPALQTDDSTQDDQSGNFGTLDMICALEWVQKHIAAFGGDPNKITIFGESAGGWNVRSLLVSPRAEGLFQRAIIQSNALRLSTLEEAQNYMDDFNPGHPQSSAELLAHLIQADGFANNRSAAKNAIAEMSDHHIAAYLRSKTLEEFDDAYRTIAEANRDRYLTREKLDSMKLGAFGPSFSVPKLIQDGSVIAIGEFGELFASGNYHRVPMIIGTTRDEDKCFLAIDPKYVNRSSGQPSAPHDSKYYNLLAEYLSKLWKASSVDEPGKAIVHHQPDTLFAYRFDWDDLPVINGIDLKLLNGAQHGIDVSFVLGGEPFVTAPELDCPLELDEASQRGYEYVSNAMMSYWANFADTGVPHRGRTGELPEWIPWNTSTAVSKLLLLDAEPSGIRMCSDYADRKEVFAQIKHDKRIPSTYERHRLYDDIFSYGITRMTWQEYQDMKKE